MGNELPYIDEHAVAVDAPRTLVWPALQRYTTSLLRGGERHPLLALLGPKPRAGFAVTESTEQRRIILAGRHRFSRYRLVFELTDAEIEQASALFKRYRGEAVWTTTHCAGYWLRRTK